jgi:enediyne biosynthesis protein E4
MIRKMLAVLMLAVCLKSNALQGGHQVPAAPPSGMKSQVCTGIEVPKFEDITAKGGITFRHISDPEKRYIVESMSGGVLLIDFDRDGWLDIYFTNSPTVEMAIKKQRSRSALYRNNGDGTFVDVTDKAGVAFPCFAFGGAVGDYNNDSWPDMYISCLGSNVLYRNNGNGTFTDVTPQAGVDDVRWSAGAAFADYDNDGFVDLAVANYVDFRFDDLPKFGSSPTCTYRGIAVQCGPRGLKGAGDSLFHNNGDGTFSDVSKSAGVDDALGFYGMQVVWSDFDDDGRPDLFVANDSTPNLMYRNEGNGKFTELGLESGTAVSEDGSEQGCMGVAIGDYDHTGKPSIYVTNFANEYNTLYKNLGKWDFRDVSYKSGVAQSSLTGVKWGTAFADFNNDTWLDLITVSGHVYPQVDVLPGQGGYREPMILQINQGNGTFCDASLQGGAPLQQKRVSRGLAVGDLFNRGVLDMVINDLDGPPMVLRNPGIPSGHWVSFELAGTKSNRLAIGAKLKLVAGGVTQTAEVRSGSSYLSQDDLRVHFGLGAHEKIDSLEIRWPSGKVEVIANIVPDRHHAIEEGSGLVPAAKIRPQKAGGSGSKKANAN